MQGFPWELAYFYCKLGFLIKIGIIKHCSQASTTNRKKNKGHPLTGV